MKPDTPDFEFTEAGDTDIEAFATFFVEAWRRSGPDAPGFAGATDDVIAELVQPDAIRARIGSPSRRMFLARSGKHVVGFSATKQIERDTVELAGIIVLPTMAGRGIGTRLVEVAVDRARGDGYRTVVVRTETTNDRALCFYQACGFKLAGVTVEQVSAAAVEVRELTLDLR